jgi:hypothetical protein
VLTFPEAPSFREGDLALLNVLAFPEAYLYFREDGLTPPKDMVLIFQPSGLMVPFAQT